MAAYCTGLVGGVVAGDISEAQGVIIWVGTATTDGMLIAGSLRDLDQNGPVATAFREVRRRITPGDDAIWELKHDIPGAIVTKPEAPTRLRLTVGMKALCWPRPAT